MTFKLVPRKYKSDQMGFEKMIAKGEGCGPDGFCAQTVNGTAYAFGSGWNKDYDWKREEVPAEGPWSGSRTNRTGE